MPEPLPTVTFRDCDTAKLEALACALAGCCNTPGEVIALEGDLGTGKTTFARSFIRHLAAEETEVSSPTFTLVQHYPLPSGNIYHFDLYRLEEAEELVEIGIEEAIEQGVCLIEWPQIAASLLPPEHIHIQITHGKEDALRDITLRGKKQYIEWLKQQIA